MTLLRRKTLIVIGERSIWFKFRYCFAQVRADAVRTRAILDVVVLVRGQVWSCSACEGVSAGGCYHSRRRGRAGFASTAYAVGRAPDLPLLRRGSA